MSHSTFNLPTVDKPTTARKRTFTLIEMLVVVVIIGILAGVLVPRLMGAKERASDSARIVKVGQISSAVELYAQEKGTTYPLAPLTTTGTSIARQDITDAISPYLTTIPTDPGKGTVAIDIPPSNIQVTGDSFAYWTNTGGTVYAITALMESKKGNTTNATQIIDSDKQGGYQKVGKGLTTIIAPGGGGGAVTYPTEAGIHYLPNKIVITDGTTTYVIADKNLGASVAGITSESYGDHYQRGNNHGFSSVPALYEPNTNGVTVDTNDYSRSNPYDDTTWRYDDPSWFSSTRNDWSTDQNDDLRGGITKTNIAMKGPCEAGYHVPTYEEWKGLVNLRSSLPGKSTSKGDGDASFNTDLFGTDLLLPKAGGRDYGSAVSVYGQGGGGRYWSSTPDGAYAYDLYFTWSSVSARSSDSRAYGFSVRCFENSY